MAEQYRTEHDTMGEVQVPLSAHYGAQTARSLVHFAIGTETMPAEVIRALIILKRAAAVVNARLGVTTAPMSDAIVSVCDRLLEDSVDGVAGAYASDFPLRVWQTGSGTQSNMNVNEVIAHLVNEKEPSLSAHPNDHVNASQSSNDTFPTAMHMACVMGIRQRLFPALEEMERVLREKEAQYTDTLKIGRTHLMDAVPMTFAQEISAWRTMISSSRKMIEDTLPYLSALAIGGTAVGTGLNAPPSFGKDCAAEISRFTGVAFTSAENKFHALSSKDACVHTHGALKALSADLMKMADDIRYLASGPRTGLHEITIPANEPGSSIMPGKVNPTQCEALAMVAAQVMANDTAVSIGAARGQFQLNVFMPLIAYNMMQSIGLLADAVRSFTTHCLAGLSANEEAMRCYVDRSLMLVTALSPKIGYDNAAKAAHKAHAEGITLKEAVVALGLLSAEEYESLVRPEKMV